MKKTELCIVASALASLVPLPSFAPKSVGPFWPSEKALQDMLSLPNPSGQKPGQQPLSEEEWQEIRKNALKMFMGFAKGSRNGDLEEKVRTAERYANGSADNFQILFKDIKEGMFAMFRDKVPAAHMNDPQSFFYKYLDFFVRGVALANENWALLDAMGRPGRTISDDLSCNFTDFIAFYKKMYVLKKQNRTGVGLKRLRMPF